jgi:hypothetical protein
MFLDGLVHGNCLLAGDSRPFLELPSRLQKALDLGQAVKHLHPTKLATDASARHHDRIYAGPQGHNKPRWVARHKALRRTFSILLNDDHATIRLFTAGCLDDHIQVRAKVLPGQPLSARFIIWANMGHPDYLSVMHTHDLIVPYRDRVFHPASRPPHHAMHTIPT